MKKTSIIMAIVMFISCIVVYGDDNVTNVTNLANIKSTEKLDTTGYKLYFGDNLTSEDISITASLSFNKEVLSGHIITETDEKLNIYGSLKESSQYTLKYEGVIEDNRFFEAFIQNKSIDKLHKNKSIYFATINILDRDENGDIIKAESYIIESLTKNELDILINKNNVEGMPYNRTDNNTSIVLSDDGSYQLISSYGTKKYYGLRTYSTSTAVENRNVVFRIQTKENDFSSYVNDNYPGNTYLSSKGRDVKLYLDGSGAKCVYNAVNPNSNSTKSFDIPIPIGDHVIEIPVMFSSVSVNNSGYANLYFLTTDASGWIDDYNTTSSLNADRAKCFVVHVVGGTSRVAKCKIIISFIVRMEDAMGIKINAYPTFDSGYFSYIG